MRKNYFNETYEQLYDPVQFRFRTIYYIEKIYGPKIYKQLVKETSEARLLRKDNPDKAFSPQLISSMKKICLEKFPGMEYEIGKSLDENILNQYHDFIDLNDVKPEVDDADSTPQQDIQRKRQPGDDFFFMLERGVVRNPEFRRMFKSKIVLWAWMWANIVREGWKDKKGYPIKIQYYDRGFLAYCSSFSKLGRDCFLDKDTVKKYVDELAVEGSIKLDFIIPDGRKMKQGVYILGEWKKVNGEISERSYLDNAYLEPKKDSPWYC